MDYKYINQLLERYWECQTTLEEEQILRAFFSQDDIPGSLMVYRDLFVYEAEETHRDVLGEDFDARLLSLIGDEKPVKARVISMRQRLSPLFRAAAVVAILLTLGNAIQVPFSQEGAENIAGYEVLDVNGVNMAHRDTVRTDSLNRSYVNTEQIPAISPY